MSNSVQSVGGGTFIANGQSMDYATLVLALQLERVDLLDKQLASQAQEIDARNKAIAKANDFLNEARNVATKSTDTAPSTGSPALRQFLVDNKIPFGNGGNPLTLLKPEWDAVIQGIKNLTDKLNSQSELDFIRVQNLNNKREQALELTTNSLQKDSKIKNDIIGNTR